MALSYVGLRYAEMQTDLRVSRQSIKWSINPLQIVPEASRKYVETGFSQTFASSRTPSTVLFQAILL